MPTDAGFLIAVAVAVVATLSALGGLWFFSGEPEQHNGPWERPGAVAQPSPVPPGFRLTLESVESGWTDQQAWTELVARLDDIATSLRAGAPSTTAPASPNESWFTAELSRLEAHLSTPRSDTGGAAKGHLQ